jgi:hypothetical protein
MATATASFRIAEFNVQGGYETIGGSWHQRLPKVVQTMLAAKASIFLLNEAHEEDDEHRQILAELERQSHTGWSLIMGDGGNHCIVDGNKHRKITTNVVRLPHSRDYIEHNFWHRSTGVRWWTWNTHLIAPDSPTRPPAMAAEMRLEQAAVIAQHLSRLRRSVGGGDANDHEYDTGLRAAIAEVGHVDVRTRVATVTNGDYDSFDRYQDNPMRGHWIDLLAAGDLCVVNSAGLVDSGDASDHNLIWASVSITGPVTQF